MMVLGPNASNPAETLLAIVEFRTMTLTGVPPAELAVMPEFPLIALTLSLMVRLMVWVAVLNV